MRITVKGLEVLHVRLALSQLARLELGAFYEAINYDSAILLKILFNAIFKFLGNLFKSKAEKNFDRRHTQSIPRIKIFFQRRSWAN